MGVDTAKLRMMLNTKDLVWSCRRAIEDAADELDALRKRCSQLERLVCEGYSADNCPFVIDRPWHLDCKGEHLGRYDTSSAAIDAAIKHMEQEASDGE